MGVKPGRLGEECRLRVFENRVLKRIFVPRRDEVTRKWRRLHNGDLYALYSTPNDKTKTELGRACSTYLWNERRIKGFVGKT
jgi:hypothetical protein